MKNFKKDFLECSQKLGIVAMEDFVLSLGEFRVVVPIVLRINGEDMYVLHDSQCTDELFEKLNVPGVNFTFMSDPDDEEVGDIEGFKELVSDWGWKPDAAT